MRGVFAVVVAACLGVFLLAQPAPSATSPASPQSGQQQEAGRRVALVIGINAYPTSPLASPVKDARDMAEVLRAAGFTLVGGGPLLDAGKQAFEQAILEFGREAQNADAALFYYSGHGMEWDQQNWMIPVDSRGGRLENIPLVDVSVDLVLQQITAAHARFSMVILDACRPNIVHPRPTHATGSGGLAAMIAPDNTVIAFATQPGDYSYDGGPGENSRYTKELLAILRIPGLELFQVFNRAALATQQATNRQQRPWTNYSPLDGEFYFLPGGAAPPGPGLAQITPPAPNPDQRPVQPPPPAPVPVPPPPSQNDPSFTLVNLSGQTVEDLRVSLSSDRNWGENRVRNHAMRSGERLGIELPAGGECKVDVRIGLTDAQRPVSSTLETCRYTTLVVTRDANVAPSNADFALVNGTGRPARAIYVSLTSDRNWGRNWLSGSMQPGNSVAIRLPRGLGCAVDVRAEFEDGSTVERRKVDTCSLERWSLN